MSDDLKRFMVSLASDVDALTNFMRDPRAAMDHGGLLPEEQDIILSGDQGRIYATIKGLPLPPPAEAPAPPQMPTVVATMLQGQQGASPAPTAQLQPAPAAQPQPMPYGSPAGQPIYCYGVPQWPPGYYYVPTWPYFAVMPQNPQAGGH